jgi:hypothetical protein
MFNHPIDRPINPVLPIAGGMVGGREGGRGTISRKLCSSVHMFSCYVLLLSSLVKPKFALQRKWFRNKRISVLTCTNEKGKWKGRGEKEKGMKRYHKMCKFNALRDIVYWGTSKYPNDLPCFNSRWIDKVKKINHSIHSFILPFIRSFIQNITNWW